MKRIARRLSSDFIDFAEHTSAHAIPRAYVSTGLRRALWLLLFFACFCAFGYQAYLIVLRFLRNDIIVGVEIKFEEIRFPAVTVCNMNPYKNSLARQLSSIKSALESFELAIDRSIGLSHDRNKRSLANTPYIRVQASYVFCSENKEHFSPDPKGSQQCICAKYTHDNFFWNCAPSSEWITRLCTKCTMMGSCEHQQNVTMHFCYCHGEYCLDIDNQIKISGRWPLQLYVESCGGEGCICVSPQSSSHDDLKVFSYCAKATQWQLEECQSCDWWGRCIRSFSLSNREDCICDGDSNRNCFAIERPRDHRKVRDTEVKDIKYVRVRKEKTRIYEKILSHYEGLLAVYSKCNCTRDSDCIALKEKELINTSTCLCFYNKKNEQIWPCYERKNWQERKCSRCNTFGDCMYSNDQNTAKIPCLCAMLIKLCVSINPPEGNSTDLSERVIKFWDILPPTFSSVQKKKQDREKAYGYMGVKDPIALKAKAIENIIFAVDQLTEDEKWAISYNKSDFILKCSFNGKECHVKQDFKAYLDPSFGACFTYIASRFDNMTNERAGPTYGLRLEVFVNVSEYLPTTEAAGVRLTVHSLDEQPFPDTLGYSAPTGFVSSFGIKLKSMVRLPSPYGDCIQQGKDDDFIYTDKQYSTEGCQRSCIQRHLAKQCGCGDPRFPPFRTTKNCPVDEPEKRECLKREILYASQHSKKIGCRCRQPCIQDVYSVSYSASHWPAVAGDQSGCPDGMTAQHCLIYKREQGAMIEVFFEQLNYESLLESEAYGLPNLLSDFGGQLGLWMGVSVITIMEVGILIFDVMLTIFGVKTKRKRTLPRRRSISSSFKYSSTRNED